MRSARLAATLAVLACLAVFAASPARAGKYALLVGIDDYPFIRERALQLHGAKTDVEQMGTVLRYCGFTPSTLEGSKATGAAVRKALREIADRAERGDSVVFFFSGRGSVAYDPKRPAAVKDLEPTLVPYNGQAQSAAADLPMREIEAWARELTGKEAAVTIFLDASYSGASRGEDRFYKNVPRSVWRPGSLRSTLYNGPGVMLAATGVRGLAYEWRVDITSDTWAGAFTDLWTNAAMRRLRQGPPPTYAEVMAEIHRFFAARPGYMTGMRPYPSADRMTADDQATSYRLPIFAATPTAPPPPPPPPPVIAKVEAAVQKHEQQEKTLRLALEASPPARSDPSRSSDPKSGPAASLKPFGDYLSKRLQMATILPQYGDRPDRILLVKRVGEGWEVQVQGDEVDVSRKPEYRGKDVAAVMGAGLLDYLQRQAYVLRLFRLTEAPSGGGTPPGWSARSEKPRYRRGESFGYLVETPRGGLLYLLDQDQSDGIVQMIWPLRQEWDNGLTPGSLRLPRAIEFQIPEEQGVGRTQTRAILVVPSPGVKLPSLQPPEGTSWKDDGTYGKAELAHLRALLEALERKQARWEAITFEYEVTE